MDRDFTTSDLAGEAGNMSEAELAAALGEELPAEEPAPEPAAEAPEPEQPQWVHEPTGKSFESELDLLRYESGYKDNKYGSENKELRAKLEAFEKMIEGVGQQPEQPVDPKKQEEMIFKAVMEQAGVDLENVEPGAYRQIFKIVEAALGMYDQGVVNKRFADLQGTVEKITTRAQQAEALNAAGITLEQVKDVLEQRPYLKKLDIGEQTAVIADLVKREPPKQGTGESPNALRQALQQPSAAGHVEGSVGTGRLDEGDEGSDRELADKLTGNDRDFLRALGAATAKAGQMPWLVD